MCSKLTEFRPMVGYEDLYIINRLGKIKAIDREVNCRGRIINLKQIPPILKKERGIDWAIIRNKEFKNVKINIPKMIKNVFGRQKQIINKRIKVSKDFIKPLNIKGRTGIPVEQYENDIIVGVFPTFASAAKAVGGLSRSVSDAAYGKRETYAGYKWKFANKNKQ